MLIDARGEVCPKPVQMAEETLTKIKEGVVEVLVDNETSADTIEWFAGKNGYGFEKSQDGNDWKLKIEKGRAVAPAPAESRHKGQLLLVVATDTMGKEEELGRVLMKAFFETMKTYRETPHTIFFLNAGVKLTTTHDEISALLKEIEAMGVEIYSCGTCLKHYGLESDLKVGHRGATNHLIGGMQDFAKTVWIG